jgi:THO complex subunit 1
MDVTVCIDQNEELNTVLSAFEGNAFSPDDLERTRDLLTSATSSTISGDTDEEMSSPTTAQDHFFQPKYLTNSRLFRLQLRDPILRECMLTQFLILLNHLTKAKQPDGCKTPKSRLQELSDRVVKLIRETPPSGKRFSEMLDLVLERERNWVKWKQEKCPSYERSPPPQEALMPKKRRMGDTPALSSRTPLPKRGKQQDSGDSSLMEQILTESSKPSAILERIRGQDRATAVPMEKFTERFAEAWDPENGIEEAYWPDKDKMFCWRTLRMAMKTNVVHMHLAASGTGAVVKAILGLPAATPAKETSEQGENATAKDEVDRMKQEATSEIKS